MNTCEKHSTKYNECVVVYDGSNCPLCEANDRIEEMDGELADKDTRIDKAEEAYDLLNEKNDELESEIGRLQDHIDILNKTLDSKQ